MNEGTLGLFSPAFPSPAGSHCPFTAQPLRPHPFNEPTPDERKVLSLFREKNHSVHPLTAPKFLLLREAWLAPTPPCLSAAVAWTPTSARASASPAPQSTRTGARSDPLRPELPGSPQGRAGTSTPDPGPAIPQLRREKNGAQHSPPGRAEPPDRKRGLGTSSPPPAHRPIGS